MRLRMTLFFSVVLFSAMSSTFAKPLTFVTFVKGTVDIFRNGKWMPANSQTVFQEGDLIKTGKDAQIDISINGKAGVRMMSATEAELKKLELNQTRFELKIGNMIANLEKYEKDSKFEVETPVAVVAVRGTQFWGRVQNPSAPLGTTFAVREGIVNVRVKESDEVFILEEGEALDIPWDESAPLEREAYEEEMQTLEQAEEIEIEGELNLSEPAEEINTEDETKASGEANGNKTDDESQSSNGHLESSGKTSGAKGRSLQGNGTRNSDLKGSANSVEESTATNGDGNEK